LPFATTYAKISIGGRLRTSIAAGLYDGTSAGAIKSDGNMNFVLAPPSVVEYYGSNQVITGLGVGLATDLNNNGYKTLEINLSGRSPADSNYAYPATGAAPFGTRAVIVATKLNLISGVLNLDNDHDPSNGGGRSIVITSGTYTAIYKNQWLHSQRIV